ncbi:hypothetical protein ACFLZ6_01075 [Nanoarchaeota archaeon]
MPPKKTADISNDFVKSVLDKDRRVNEKCEANLETLFLDLDKTIKLLDETSNFLNAFLKARKELDEEIRRKEEAKKKKKKKTDEAEEEIEEEIEEETDEAAEEAADEEEKERQPRFVETVLGYEEKIKTFVSQIKTSLANSSEMKDNSKEIKSMAKEDMTDASFPEKLMKARLDLFIPKLKADFIEKTINDVKSAKKSYQILIEKVVPSLSDTGLASSEVSAISDTNFIDSYSKMKEYAESRKEEYMKSIGPGAFDAIKKSFIDIYGALFGSLNEFYPGMLDKQFLTFIKQYKKSHSKCISRVNTLNKIMAKQKMFLSKKARKSIERINKLVSK